VTDFIVFHFEDSLHVEQFSKPTTVKTRMGEFVIETSLWNAIVGANMNMALALQLSDIYAWTVDFFGLQKGDGFKVYYDELFVDTVSVGISKIHAACYTHGDKELYAVFYENDEVSGYWDLEGNNMKKAFLKAPLSFSRISSKFTYARKHPVYKTVRPHTGVDYAAPMGTPVMAIGDGVVTFKGYKGGGGHTVKIRHNSTYESAYLHLSKYGKGIATGARVTQGQVIGYVGSSGTSTGAHLDFRIWKNGTPIDPLKMESPPTEPIPSNARAEFDSVKTVMVNILNN
jgi:murein DD-endopeptidase MepM/ murein hydrolase activator NlpD